MQENLKLFSFLSASVLCFLASFSWAEKADRDKPIYIESHQAYADEVKKVRIFEGEVKVNQGSLFIKAARVEVQENAQGKIRLHATGKPVFFRQKQDNNQGMVEGEALRIEYEETSGQADLYQKAWVKRGADLIKGDILHYNTQTGVFSGMAAPNQRVNVIIQPKPRAPAATQGQGATR